MPKRSFAMALAMALFACLAFSAPCEAGLVLVTTSFDFVGIPAGSTVTDVTITYNTDNISDVKAIDPANSTIATNGINTVTETFPSMMSSGSAKWTFETTDTFGIGLTNVVFSGGVGATFNLSITTSPIPEPASMSLLGIGMAGLVAFRRYFRRNPNVRS